MSELLRHVIEAVQPASAAMAAARAEAGPLASWLAGARHAPAPRLDRRVVLCVACDHAVVDAGVAFGAQHPTALALAAIAGGTAALAHAARTAGAPVVIVDAGLVEPDQRPAAAIAVAEGRAGDLSEARALTGAQAVAAVEAGVALVTALAEDGLELLAVGGLGAGSDLAAAAVIAALVGGGVELAPRDGRNLVALGLARVNRGAAPLDVLAQVGGRDIGVLTGALLAAATLHVPVVLDGTVTLAAALVGARLAPALPGYLLAAHGGGGAAGAAARAALALTPLLTAGIGQGEGTAAAMMLPVIAASVS